MRTRPRLRKRPTPPAATGRLTRDATCTERQRAGGFARKTRAALAVQAPHPRKLTPLDQPSVGPQAGQLTELWTYAAVLRTPAIFFSASNSASTSNVTPLMRRALAAATVRAQ